MAVFVSPGLSRGSARKARNTVIQLQVQMAQRTPSSDLAVCVAHESFSRSRKASKSTSSLPSLARSARGAPSGAARLRRDVAAAVTPRPATAIGTAAKPSTNPTMSSTRAVWHRTPITPVHVGRGARCQNQDQMRPKNMHMCRAVTAVTGNLRDPAQEATIRPPHLLRFALPRPVCPLAGHKVLDVAKCGSRALQLSHGPWSFCFSSC